jgi:mRNA interferase MazF
MAKYVPEKGDLIALSFDPQTGHEQKGRRPALVISNYLFNRHTGLAIVCPITRRDRKIPFHLEVHTKSLVTGFVMVDQIKSVDYIARKAKFIGKASSRLVTDALSVLDACVK